MDLFKAELLTRQSSGAAAHPAADPAPAVLPAAQPGQRQPSGFDRDSGLDPHTTGTETTLNPRPGKL
jgi:hypothetical protein